MWKSFILKLWLSFSSFLWFVVFLLPNLIKIRPLCCLFITLKKWVSEPQATIMIYVWIIAICILISWIILLITTKFWNKTETLNAISIKPAESSFLPTYIWLFVIALSLECCGMIFYYSILLFILRLLLEKISYFNIFFRIFWYRFYEVIDDYNITYVLITKREDLKKNNIGFKNLIRLNNFTFLES